MSIRSFVVLLVGLLCLGRTEAQAQVHGVLLGIRYEEPIPRPLPYYAGSADSLSHDAYQTLLVWKDTNSYAVHADTSNLLIPRPNGFWRAGTKRSIYNNWVEDFVWAAPEDAPRELAGIQSFNGEYCEGHRAQTIHYAGPRYLSLQQQSAGYCEGAAHPWFFNTFAVVPIDSTTHTGVEISTVLGEAAYTTFEEHVRTYLDGLRDARRGVYAELPDPANWAIIHREGQWSVVGRLESAEAIAPGHVVDLTLPISVPTTLTGPAPDLPSWRQIQAAVPEAVDLVMAPEGTWLVLLRPNRLTIHPYTNGRIGVAMLSHPLPPGSHVVMARWATGARLRDWLPHFEPLTVSAPPP